MVKIVRVLAPLGKRVNIMVTLLPSRFDDLLVGDGSQQAGPFEYLDAQRCQQLCRFARELVLGLLLKREELRRSRKQLSAKHCPARVLSD